jgi:5-methylcytosine-specific restriction endonuclease McrA
VAGISPGGDYAELLVRAVAAVIAGDQALAEGELAPIAGLTGKPAQSDRLPTLSLRGWPTATHPPTRNPPKRDLARVFARDSYTCVYCGRRTVFPGVLRLLSRLFPTAFPLQANWKLAETHRAYWDIPTSVDHICPVSRGGDWQEVEPGHSVLPVPRPEVQPPTERARVGASPTTAYRVGRVDQALQGAVDRHGATSWRPSRVDTPQWENVSSCLAATP